MKKESPSIDAWLKEAKQSKQANRIGMYLVHNGVVREDAKAMVRQGETDTKPVSGMYFSYDEEKVNAAIEAAYEMEGIYYIKVWLNEGDLKVGDDIMYVLIGGDIRPHLVGTIKNSCVTEDEKY